ncbi:cobalamin biosynthesis protein P47K [Acetobacterium malicum]|uniref:Cobalamin biosynthesis protein P47K n=1 Tax=Acetobacterium malicum TaxID=52692 RepID=A0ABR6Z1R3_9FIRM|nr:GTP-binding protein [Acetobacterium malicum]MBC3901185.1 cobalamin biosynthesis protein P47K [Acetobacterium malicum]
MKILILGGFLGSGKTSVLMQLAEYLVSLEKEYHSEVKVAIVENEIGAIGIDDKVLKKAGFIVNNLFSGCACCSLTGELVASIKKIQTELDPQWLIIEATGVAYPGSIRTVILDEVGLDATILIIADAKRWQRLVNAMELLVSGQLEDTSIVLLNKVDLISSAELIQVEHSILNYNQTAEVIPISAKAVIPEDILKKIVNQAEDLYDNKA